MPKTLKRYLMDTDNEEILEDYQKELAEERRKKARERAKVVYDAGRKALNRRTAR